MPLLVGHMRAPLAVISSGMVAAIAACERYAPPANQQGGPQRAAIVPHIWWLLGTCYISTIFLGENQDKLHGMHAECQPAEPVQHIVRSTEGCAYVDAQRATSSITGRPAHETEIQMSEELYGWCRLAGARCSLYPHCTPLGGWGGTHSC
jgi:hypothetical protein